MKKDNRNEIKSTAHSKYICLYQIKNQRIAGILYVIGCAEEVCIVLGCAALHKNMANSLVILCGNINPLNNG